MTTKGAKIFRKSSVGGAGVTSTPIELHIIIGTVKENIKSHTHLDFNYLYRLYNNNIISTSADRLRLVWSVARHAAPFATRRRRNEPAKIIRKHCTHRSRACYDIIILCDYVTHDISPHSTRVPTYHGTVFGTELSPRIVIYYYYMFITKYTRADRVATNRSTFRIGSGSFNKHHDISERVSHDRGSIILLGV